MRRAPTPAALVATGRLPRDRSRRCSTSWRRVVVGQDRLLDRCCLPAPRGHVLAGGRAGPGEDPHAQPSRACAAEFARIQFTPDLLLGRGGRAGCCARGTATSRPGSAPSTQLVLADEINRAPAKVQSALPRGRWRRATPRSPARRHSTTDPFFVLATQNRSRARASTSLPEAQVDRFAMSSSSGTAWPTRRRSCAHGLRSTRPRRLLDPSRCAGFGGRQDTVFVTTGRAYAVRLVNATRDPTRGPGRPRPLPRPGRLPARRSPWSATPSPSPCCGDGTTPCPRTWPACSTTRCAIGSC